MGKVVETAAKSLTNVLSGMAAAAGPPVLALRGGGDAPARVEYHRFDDKFGMRVFSRASDATQVENAVLYKTNEVVSDRCQALQSPANFDRTGALDDPGGSSASTSLGTVVR